MKNNFNCGKRIRAMRQARSLSQETLALNAGITPAYLGLIERGQRNATVAIIERICGALGVSLSEFFSDAESPSQIEDDIGKQILHQLNGLNREEKQAMLQLVKSTIHLRHLAIKNTSE